MPFHCVWRERHFQLKKQMWNVLKSSIWYDLIWVKMGGNKKAVRLNESDLLIWAKNEGQVKWESKHFDVTAHNPWNGKYLQTFAGILKIWDNSGPLLRTTVAGGVMLAVWEEEKELSEVTCREARTAFSHRHMKGSIHELSAHTSAKQLATS